MGKILLALAVVAVLLITGRGIKAAADLLARMAGEIHPFPPPEDVQGQRDRQDGGKNGRTPEGFK